MTRPDDIRNLANYTYADAARLIGTYGANLCRWIKMWGDRSQLGTWKCSYYDLSAALVVKFLRNQGFSLRQIRRAYEVGRTHRGINNVLLHKHLCHDGKVLLFKKEDDSEECYRLDRSEIIEINDLIDPFLERVYFDGAGWTHKLHPCTEMHPRTETLTYFHVIVDPTIGFGYPVVRGTRLSTSALASYYIAGNSKQDIAEHFNLNPEALDQALAFEDATAADLSG